MKEAVRSYRIEVGEKYERYGSSCHIATVDVVAGSAERAIKQAFEKVEDKIESGPLCVLTIECFDRVQLLK